MKEDQGAWMLGGSKGRHKEQEEESRDLVEQGEETAERVTTIKETTNSNI